MKYYKNGRIPDHFFIHYDKYKQMSREKLIEDQLKTTVSLSHYNGWNNRTKFGYHSYNIDEIDIKGQRNPKMRLDCFRKNVDFA